ncbi:hypothetical protein D3C76_763220 [compost metagenome]
MAQRQRAGDRVIKAIGPARVGQVPEVVLGAQVDGIAHVALERDDGTQRHFQRFGRAGGARGEHQQERVVARAHDRLAIVCGIVHALLEVQLATAGIDGDDGRAGMHIVQLGAVVAVGDDHAGVGLLQAMFDGLGAESGEQWLVHRPEAPGGKDGDQQLGGTRHQAGDPVTRTHALRFEHIGETGSQCLQLIEAQPLAVALAAFPDQCGLALTGMAVATFDTGIEGFEVAMQRRRSSLAMVERTSGLGVIAHRRTPGFLFLELNHRSNDVRAAQAWRQWPKLSIWMTGLAACSQPSPRSAACR